MDKGLFASLREAIRPHAENLNGEIALQGARLHSRLARIEGAVSDLARGDIGDNWQRFVVRGKKKAEEIELGICPLNEIWLIQSIASDGVQEKSPACVLLVNGILLESVIKEGLGFEGISGNAVVLPGESLTFLAREEGNFNLVVTLIRRQIPVVTLQDKTRDIPSSDRHPPRSIHEPERDAILGRVQYTESPPEVAATEGKAN